LTLAAIGPLTIEESKEKARIPGLLGLPECRKEVVKEAESSRKVIADFRSE
jgi:hypothetical protein